MCLNAEISLIKKKTQKKLCSMETIRIFLLYSSWKKLFWCYIFLGPHYTFSRLLLLLFPPVHQISMNSLYFFLSPDWPPHPHTDFLFPLLYCFPHLAPHWHLIPPSGAHFMYQPSFCPSSNLLYSSVLYHFFSSISTKACLPPRLPIYSVLSCLWLPLWKP